MTRRTLLLSATALGVSMVAACSTPTGGDTAATPGGPAPTDPGGVDVTPAVNRFGVDRYNTREVADELRYIEENITPPPGGAGKRVLITGSTAGIGQLAAAHLLRRGHRVVAHARDDQRAADVRRDLPDLHSVVVGDLLHLDQTRALADQINELGEFDVVIHNAGEYGLSDAEILNANSLSPYLLTGLVRAPREAMMYLTSDLHLGGDLKLDVVRSGGTDVNYNDSKLHMATLAMAVARRRPGLRVNAVAPGWVPTVMGFHNGPYAPDDLRAGYLTQVWLTEAAEPASQVSGVFLFHQEREDQVHPDVYDAAAQDALLAAYAERTGVMLD